MNIKNVCKRDGRIVDFDIEKVQNAIYSALKSVNDIDVKQQRTEDTLCTLATTYANQVKVVLCSSSETDTPKVEQIQDVVENVLIRNNETLASKHYILYRNDRTKVREMNTTIMNTMKRITFNDSKNVDLMRENANIDGDSAMGTMLRYGSETSKEFVKSFMLRPEIAKAQIDGDIHIHDMDFYNLTCTCVTEDTKIILKTPEGTFGTTLEYLNKYFTDEDKQTVAINDIQILSINNEFVPLVACTRRLLDKDEKVYHIETDIESLDLTGEHRVPIKSYGSSLCSIHTRLSYVHNLKLGDILISNDSNMHINSNDLNLVIFAGDVEHKITGISYRDYNSYVYDIQTANEYYDANGYIIHNCVQIDTKKLFKNGFSTGHGVLREPNGIISASALTCIAIQANQNDMHGGQSIPALDYYLAPYVKKTFIKQLHNILDSRDEISTNSIMKAIKELSDDCKSLLSVASIKKIIDVLEHFGVKNASKIVDKAISYTDTATHQAMEAMVHNLNSMQSRAGAQVPFSSLNFGTDTSAEGRMVSKNLLIATDEGLGNGETPIFPISIFKIKEGVNYNETDPNYDLFKLACKVSAKRLFPNFSNLDAPFNKMYYKEGNIDTEASYMGCVDGAEVITYKIDNNLYVEPFDVAYDRVKEIGTERTYGTSYYVDCTNLNISIHDSSSNTEFVSVKKFIKNPNRNNWKQIVFSNGRQLLATDDHPLPIINKGRTSVKDMQIGDSVPIIYLQYSSSNDKKCSSVLSTDSAWLHGILYNESTVDELNTLLTSYCDTRCAYIAGMLDANSEKIIANNAKYATVTLTNKSIALQHMALIQSVFIPCEISSDVNNDITTYTLTYKPTMRLARYVRNSNVKKLLEHIENKFVDYGIATITSITDSNYTGFSYDVETESDRFDVSGILSHNCRTRVVANNYDKNNEIVTGRGNVSFTSINLPRLAIKAEHNIKTFIDLLDKEMELVFTQLLDRFEVQGKRKAKNYPFLMGQGIWINSDSLAPNDEVKEVIKNGSLTTGFIGLAECLTALIGQHHGQSEEAQELGLMIIGYMREKCDKKSEETGLNFTLIATPAEGLSGRFVKIDKEKYGIIEGVTDKDYYTNSMHIPVSFPISIYDKIRLEAPYHALTNGGHITYVEVDGDPLQNLDAFEDIIRLGHDMGLGYFSINHPVDRDSVCGYTGIIGDTCPRCGRHEGEGIELEKLLQLKKKYPDIIIPYIEEYKENYLS